MRPENARLLAIWDRLRSSYWFIPSLMTVGALLLSFVTTTVDGRIGPEWIEAVGWLYGNQPDGARALLSTVAGSMIGVAGVTFSITIASVVYASGQYGPRLLTNFMQDTGNQVTLGTFIATYVYCLMVMRTVRAASEVTGATAFVPHIAVVTAVALALASIAVLIFFIHHVPESIHVSNVIAGIGKELQDKVETLFPQRIGRGEPADENEDVRTEIPEAFYEEAEPARAAHAGYLLAVDSERLMDIAVKYDLLIRLKYRPGDFISEGESIALVWYAEAHESDEVASRLHSAFAFGRSRTPMQDVRFLLDELVEIAARALSPGVNDPFTAITCMDWLGAALKALAERDTPGPRRYDERGALRIIAAPTGFPEFIEDAVGQLRPYAAADRNAALHMLRIIGEVAGRLGDDQPERRAALRRELESFLSVAASKLDAPDAEVLLDRARTVRRLLSGTGDYNAIVGSSNWLGGSA